MAAADLSERLVVSPNGDGDHTTIAAALAAAAPGALVELLPGVYREAVEVELPVSISARGDRGSVVIEGPAGSAALRVAAERVSLDGLTIRGGQALAAAGSTLVVEGCDLVGETLLQEASAGFTDCTFAAADGVALTLERCLEATLEASRLAGPTALAATHGGTLALNRCALAGSQVAAVTLEAAGTAVLFEGCALSGDAPVGLAVLSGTAVLRSCTITAGDTIVHCSGTDTKPRLEDCELQGGKTGVAIVDGADPVLDRCRIHGQSERGVLVGEHGRGTLSGCEIADVAGRGVLVESGGEPNLADCTVAGSELGIALGERGGGSFTGCTVSGARSAGIALFGGSAGDFERCGVSGNGVGVYAEAGATAHVAGCDLRGNAGGSWNLADGARLETTQNEQDDGSSRSAPAAAAVQAPGAPPAADASARPADLDALLAELDALTGLAEVKEQVRSVAAFLRVQAERRSRGFASVEVSHHLVFSGNPGTGKTTVARLLSRMYAALGLLAKGHLVEADRSSLVAEYAGQTAPRTNALVNSALGGILFVDEAYTLSEHSNEGDAYGQEAIDTLLKRMEDDRDQLVVIVAGYPAKMKEFVESNPGLASRFPRTIDFPDYTNDELVEIVGDMCKQNQYALADACGAKLTEIFAAAPRREGFGNARLARNLFEAAVTAQSTRLGSEAAPSDAELTTLVVDDFVAAAAVAVSR